jgi:hypothetical protein
MHEPPAPGTNPERQGLGTGESRIPLGSMRARGRGRFDSLVRSTATCGSVASSWEAAFGRGQSPPRPVHRLRTPGELAFGKASFSESNITDRTVARS